MANQSYTQPASVSERLYRVLLQLYPRAFREEYATEMLYAFRDAYTDATQHEGIWGLARLWSDFSSDLIKAACIQHIRHIAMFGERRLALAGAEFARQTLRFSIESAHHTDIGKARTTNEDSLLALTPDDSDVLRDKGVLLIVADGMGGERRGKMASELVTQRIQTAYYHDHQDDPLTSLLAAFQQANEALLQTNQVAGVQNADPYPPGTTCVAAVLRDTTLSVANVGDSRAYVLHDGRLRQITRDHSLVAQLIERGEITPAEARTHAQRSQIYRALGMPEVEVDGFIEAVQPGDTLLLCTDGLSNQMDDEEMRAVLERYSPEESVQRLIACANERGGPDNITAIVVRIAAA